MNKIVEISEDDWVANLRLPNEISDKTSVTLLMHGWTGDEKSMWNFGNSIPENHIVIAPRGFYPSTHKDLGGYSWVGERSGDWSWYKDYLPSITKTQNLIEICSKKYSFSARKINMVGFSQGAAFTYAYLFSNPEQMNSAAGLGGFLPPNISEEVSNIKLNGLNVFISHGTLDNIVPIELADISEKFLSDRGANVVRCNSEVKHKVGANCLKKLSEFMKFV
jgi:phospholipase/carboxylesterase